MKNLVPPSIERGVPTRPRRGILLNLVALTSSPANALILCYFGFYSLAPLVNIFMSGDASGSVLVRVIIFLVTLIALVRVGRFPAPNIYVFVFPGFLFNAIFTLRLLENYFISGIDVPPGPSIVLPIYLISGIASAFALVRLSRFVRDVDFYWCTSLLVSLFLAGLWLNLDALSQTLESRMQLDKINPIALGHTAVSYLLYYVVVATRSKKNMFEAILVCPLLVAVVALARSRGAYISGGITILIYVLMLRGTRRVMVALGVTIAGAIVLYLFSSRNGPDLVEIVTQRLEVTDAVTDAATYGRIISFEGAWNQFLRDPVLGRYAIELSTGWYPHNIYLEALMSTGLVGGIVFGIHLALASRAAVGIIRWKQAPAFAVVSALLFIKDSIGAGMSSSIWGATGFWLTSFLVIAVFYSRSSSSKSKRLFA